MPRRSFLGRVLLVIFVFMVGIFVLNRVASVVSGPEASSTVSPTASVHTSSLTPEEKAERQKRMEDEAKWKAALAAAALGIRWHYSESADPMGRGTIKYATIRSLNTTEFDFPYRGAQRATLTLRVHPAHGRDVLLSIERGQFLCRRDNCSVAVRFGEGKPQNFSATEPADNSTTTIFLRSYDRFLAAAKKSDKIAIEAQFFQHGARVFEFDTAGLKF